MFLQVLLRRTIQLNSHPSPCKHIPYPQTYFPRIYEDRLHGLQGTI